MGEVGEEDKEDEYYIWTKKKLEIGYRDNQVSKMMTMKLSLLPVTPL